MALPLLQVKMFRLCSISNQFRNVVCPKYQNILVQPSRRIKQTVDTKLAIPEKPKRPMTAFFKFLQQIRPTLYQENPHIKIADVGKVAGQRWEKVDPKLKSEFEAEYKREMETYRVSKVNYENSLTTEQKIEIKEKNVVNLQSKEKKMLKKKVRDLGRPKKPATSFLRYLKERRLERGDTPMKEWQRRLSKEWEAESETTKAKYNDIIQKEKLKYQQDLLEWEENMIKQGHMDVVRTAALLPKPFNYK